MRQIAWGQPVAEGATLATVMGRDIVAAAILTSAGLPACSGHSDEPEPATSPGDLTMKAPTANDGFQIETQGAWIEPGDGAEWCEVISLPGQPGETFFLSAVEVQATPLLHHMVVDLLPMDFDGDREERQRCNGADALFGDAARPLVGVTQLRDRRELPNGVGQRLHAAQPLVVDYHYINTTPERAFAQQRVNLYVSDRVDAEARSFELAGPPVHVGPQQRATFQQSCTFDQKVMVSELIRRTRQAGNEFAVWRYGGAEDGERVWTSNDWEFETSVDLQPVLTLDPGEGFRFECVFENGDAEALEEGPDATCALLGSYFTETPEVPPVMPECDVSG